LKSKQPNAIQEFKIYNKPNLHKDETIINKYYLFTLIVTEYCTISPFSVWPIHIYRTLKFVGEEICFVHVTECQNWHSVNVLTFHLPTRQAWLNHWTQGTSLRHRGGNRIYICLSILPTCRSSLKLSCWVSGFIWNTRFQQYSVTDS
jgi:hypothetical protein